MDSSRVLHGVERTLVMAAVMATVFIQVLDMTIANVALPHMASTLGASPESINWVLTSYIVAAAIATPITGWLADHVGRRKLMIWSTVAFTSASVLCAVATSLPEMVLFRIIQGIGGAFILPLGQATIFDIHEPKDHPKAMAVYGAGLVMAPILGPVLGGWLTDNYSWRWVFLINLPIGLVATVLLIRVMPRFGKRKSPFDIAGFFLIALFLASLQLALDRGHTKDWFDSTEIWIETALAIGALWMFAVHTATSRHSLFDRQMLFNRNFAIGMLFMVVTGAMLMCGLALTPPLLQQLMGYSVLQSGMLTGIRGVGVLISMQAATRLSSRVDPRAMIALAIVISAASFYVMSRFSLDMDWRPVALAGLIQGFGIGLLFVPVQSLAFATITPQMRTSAASLFNLARSMGGSIGIAIMGALLARNAQVSHADLSAHVTSQSFPLGDPAVVDRIGDAGQAMLAMINAEVSRQALFIAYIDDYWLLMWAALASLPLLLLVGKQQLGAKPDATMVHAD